MVDAHLIIAVFHIVAVVPLLLYVGFQRAATVEWVYHLLFGLGLLIIAYHGIKAFNRWLAKSPSIWVNLVHALIVAPLLLWIGYFGKKTERPAYEMLVLVAFGALGYHIKTLVLTAQTFSKGD